MQTLIIVLEDLWDFILRDFFVFKGEKPQTKVLALPPLSSVPSSGNPVVKAKQPPTPASYAPAVVTNEGTEAFVTVEKAQVFNRPVFTYDGVIKKLSYAAKVSVLGYEGRFARIFLGDATGWILKDEISSHAEDVLPKLHQAEIYSANHPDTQKLRKLIEDEFFAAELFLPLQAVEFVTYKLFQAKHKIVWPGVRPRMAGSWQNILKGQLGIQIGVLPKTGAIIEFTKADGVGFVGYTKAVHIDETIIIEGVGRLIEGEYREELMSKVEWQEWRPVWIAVS